MYIYMALEMAHTDGKVIHTWIFLCRGFLAKVIIWLVVGCKSIRGVQK